MAERDWNASRLVPSDAGGSYESYFLRANHPVRPLAFWIRYTAFVPQGRPGEACGELWAIVFDGDAGRIVAAKQSVPLADCAFSPGGLDVRIGSATLREGALDGGASSGAHRVDWSLRYAGQGPPLLLLPERFYDRGLPRAKALVGGPNAAFTGVLVVDGDEVPIEGWTGSQNHNWGSRHTDRYAWAQVAGFDDAPEAFLECSTAQLKIGPIWTPRVTLAVLRDEGEEWRLNGLLQGARATAAIEGFDWTFETRSRDVRIAARIHAPAGSFVGLSYANPPGGAKTCLNTKIASAEVTVERPGRPARVLRTEHRAAFEILTDRTGHGVAVVL